MQAVGVLLAGLVGLIGLLLTWRNQRLTQRSLEDTRRNTQEQLRLTEQRQITERFTRAIDQLGATDDDGNPRLEIRLGGIYALERIDKESPKRAYHSTVMEGLTAYVRENAPWPAKSSKSPEWGFIKPPEGNSVPNSAPNEAAKQNEGAEQGVELTSRTPRTDIQAILDVLNRREEDHVPKQHRVGLDLQGANLLGANLLGANLQGAYVDQEQIESTIGSSETKLPEGLNHPQLWSKSLHEQIEQIRILQERINRAELPIATTFEGRP